MSRKAFEQAVEDDFEKPTFTALERDEDGYMDSYVDNAWWGWQACEQHYQQRIAEQKAYYESVIADGGKRITELESKLATMAALVAKKDEALDNLAEHAQWGGDIYYYQKWVNGVATEALALTADGVELVEVSVEDHLCAVITEAGGYTKYNGPTVYTIKVKP